MATATENQNDQSNKVLVPKLEADSRALGFRKVLESPRMQSSLRAALPKHIKPERMIRVVMGAFQRTPKLLECDPNSVMYSILLASSLGLECDGALGDGYLLPYKGQCQFIPGFRGLMKLARQSGIVADISAEVVYEKDHFEYEFGLDQKLKHKRNDDVADPGKLKYAYAVARFRDGERKFVVLNRREIERIKASSQMSSRGPWVDHEAEMWKKTAVRRLCKMLPMSSEIQRGIRDEDDLERGGTIEIPEMNLLPAPVDVDAGVDASAAAEPTGDRLFPKTQSAQES
jgi:recombination protein RecT